MLKNSKEPAFLCEECGKISYDNHICEKLQLEWINETQFVNTIDSQEQKQVFEKIIEKIIESINNNKNIQIFGPGGVGKS